MMGVGRAGRSYGWDTAGRGLTKGALADGVPKQATRPRRSHYLSTHRRQKSEFCFFRFPGQLRLQRAVNSRHYIVEGRSHGSPVVSAEAA